MTKNGQYKYLGKPHKAVDGLEKVTGYAKFTPDVHLQGMLYIRPIFSPYAHAIIGEIDKTEAEGMPGVVAVLTAADLPTFARVGNSRNSSVLAKERVQWAGQPVAVVVAESEAEAADAAEMVFIDYDPLPAAVNLLEAIKPGAPVVWPNGIPEEGDDLASLHTQQVEGDAAADGEKLNNVINESHFDRGDVEADFAAAYLVKEGAFDLKSLHQAYLEPHAVAAEPDPLGRSLTIYTSTQSMHSVRDETARLLGMPQHSVTIKPMTVGGAFGAKYGIYEPLVGAVAMTLRRPVRLFLSRSEDFLSTTPAPHIHIDLKVGFKEDGTVTGLKARVLTNNGVFGFGHGGIIATLIAGTYKWQSVKIDTYEVHTHTVPVGAYRAPGAPHATFAIEALMDEAARDFRVDPIELRLQNVVDGGDLTGTGQPWPQQLGARQVLEEAQKHPLWKNRRPGDGTGIALGGWPSFMGSADATCRVDTDGRVRINLGIVDISGVKSGFVLVAAEALGVDPSEIGIVQDDTNGAYGPNSGGSQVTYTVAGAVHSAAIEARRQLVDQAAEMFEAAPEDIELKESHAQVVGVPDKKIHIGKLAAAARGKRGGPGPIVGDGKSAPPENGPGFVVQIAKIEVDEISGEITPVAHVTIQDVGFAINPLLAEGQVLGGTLQGIGMGLYEAMVQDENGTLLTGSFMDYGIPRSDNSPDLEVILVENPSPHGPFGARGIGEPPITAAAAALANAVRDATGARITSVPMTAETLWRAREQVV